MDAMLAKKPKSTITLAVEWGSDCFSGASLRSYRRKSFCCKMMAAVYASSRAAASQRSLSETSMPYLASILTATPTHSHCWTRPSAKVAF